MVAIGLTILMIGDSIRFQTKWLSDDPTELKKAF